MANIGQFHYEMTLRYNGKFWSDINYCLFIRQPSNKHSSYCLLRAFIPQLVISEMLNIIGSESFPNVSLEIWRCSESKPLTDRTMIFKKHLLCVGCIPAENLVYEDDRVHADLILVHPIIFYLNSHNTFNQYFLETTADGVLKAYEGFLTAQHGPIFKFEEMGVSKFKSSYIYEQLLVRAPSDLDVPNFLIQTYKVLSVPSFYFFDAFNLTDKTTKDVTVFHLSHFDKNCMIIDDVREYYDKSMDIKLINEQPFIDIQKELSNKGDNGHRVIFNHQDIKFQHEKLPVETVLPKMEMASVTENIIVQDGPRKIKTAIASAPSVHTYGGTSSSSTYYAPDSPGDAQQRFSNGVSFLKGTIQSSVTFELANCIPDFPKFGYRYNLDSKHVNEYIYTPHTIINQFTRKNTKEHYLYHLSKVLMFKYG